MSVRAYAEGARRAPCGTQAVFDPFPPLASVTAVATVLPYRGLDGQSFA